MTRVYTRVSVARMRAAGDQQGTVHAGLETAHGDDQVRGCDQMVSGGRIWHVCGTSLSLRL